MQMAEKELQAGDRAPAFNLKNAAGQSVKLADFKGRKLVLYFYPKDATPGCTKEACSFRDAYAQLKQRGVEVVGVSADDAKSHQKFADKFSLPFPLLSDPDRTVIDQMRASLTSFFRGGTLIHRRDAEFRRDRAE
jgi:thioredoxin-dependent peroxiredoxin